MLIELDWILIGILIGYLIFGGKKDKDNKD
jgi:hypothetical protein